MHLIWPIRQHIRLIHERRSLGPACTRDLRHARCMRTPSDGYSEQWGRERQGPSDRGPSGRGPSDQLPQQRRVRAAWSMHCDPMPHPSARVNARHPSPGARRMCACPAPPLCRCSMRKREIDRRCRSGYRTSSRMRTEEAVDSTAMDAKAAAAKDTTAAREVMVHTTER